MSSHGFSHSSKPKTDGWLVWFYGISTIFGYLMPNPLYTLNIYDLIWFYVITIVGYLMLNPLYTYIFIKYIYNMVWLDFMAYPPL